MVALTWDQVGTRLYETGVDHGVLYIPNAQGVYNMGYAWNGLTTVTESPSGAEATAQYADNIKYLNLISAEEFGATIEAFTYPDEFAQCDGSAAPTPGVALGQQTRKTFGLSYRTKVGDDLVGDDKGYKLHLIYGATAAPTEKAYATINDSPEAITFSWEISSTPVAVTGYKPTSVLTIDSTKVDPTKLAQVEALLYGTAGVDAALPTPAEIIAMFGTTILVPVVTAPTYVLATKIITIPATTGVIYQIDGVTKAAGALPAITKDTVVTAKPVVGYRFPAVTDDDWFFSFT
jgi:hypothetical protein